MIGPLVKTVQNAIDFTIKAWGDSTKYSNSGNKNPHEANLLMLNSKIANNLLTWKPLHNFDEALNATIAW